MLMIVVLWSLGYTRFVLHLPRPVECDPAWREQWADLLLKEGIREEIPLHVTERVGPMLSRLPSGHRLLAPVELWRQLTPAGRESVLRHELEHWKRGDVWKSLAARLLALPHWFNPLAWLAARQFDEAAEWACDAAARGDSPAAAAQYAQSLLTLNQWAGRWTLYRPAAWGRGTSQRIRRLVCPNFTEDTIVKKILVLGAAFILAAVCLIRVELVAKEPVDKEPALTKGGDAIPTALAAENIEDAPASATESEKSTPSPKPSEREALRYDGKNFAYWCDELRNEMKVAHKAEAIMALTEFGRRGYGKEATVAILEAMRDYSVKNMTIPKSPGEGLREAALAAFNPDMTGVGQKILPIDPKHAVPILANELKVGNENSRLFAAFAIFELGPLAKDAIGSLLDAYDTEKDPDIARKEAEALFLADATGDAMIRLYKKMAAGDMERTEMWIYFMQNTNGPNGIFIILPTATGDIKLTAKGQKIYEFLVDRLEDKDSKIRLISLIALRNFQPYYLEKEALAKIIRIIEKGDPLASMKLDPALKILFAHGQSTELDLAIGLLSNHGVKAKDAVPALIKVFQQTERMPTKILIVGTLGSIGPAAKAALPMLSEESHKYPSPDMHVIAESEDENRMVMTLKFAFDSIVRPVEEPKKQVSGPRGGMPPGYGGPGMMPGGGVPGGMMPPGYGPARPGANQPPDPWPEGIPKPWKQEQTPETQKR